MAGFKREEKETVEQSSAIKIVVVLIVLLFLISGFSVMVHGYGPVMSASPSGISGNISNTNITPFTQNSSQNNSAGYVKYTLDLMNDTLINGNFVNTLNGISPLGVAFDSANGYIYVTNFGSNDISVINGATNVVIASINVGSESEPAGVAYDPSNGYIYVANWHLDNVSVINGATNKVIANISVGFFPSGVAFDSANGYIYVTGQWPNSVSVINGATNKVIANISVGSSSLGVTSPLGVAFDSANGYIYVTNSGSNNVSVINGATNEVIANINVGSSPLGVAFDSANGYIYVTNEGSENVSVINGATNKVIASISVGLLPSGVAFDSANGYIYVTNQYSISVSVINGATNKVIANISVGSSPLGVTSTLGVAFDSANGYIYVTNSGSNNVSVINGATNEVIASIDLANPIPTGVAFDSSNGYVYMTNDGSNDVSVINGATNTVIANIYIRSNSEGGAFGSAVAFDSANGYIYVTKSGSNDVSVINGATNKVIASISVGFIGLFPPGLAFDPSNGYVYVTNGFSSNVSVINGATNKVIASIAVGLNPEGVAYDSSNGYVYVTNGFSSNVSVINGTTNSVIANINVGAGPEGVAFDSANGYIYVTNSGSNNVSVINGTTNSVIANINVGAGPEGVAYDPSNGYIYVTNFNSNDVSVINGATNEVIANISVGSYPYGVALDSANGYIYVTNSYSGSVSIISTSPQVIKKYTVTFTESGLPSGTSWSVTFNGTTESSSTNTITFSEPNGTYSYSIAAVSGYKVSPSSGSITVNGKNVNQAITFTSVTTTSYTITFTESGLPTGTSWSVTLNGNTETSTTNTISFTEPNGTYSFSIASINGYSVSPSSGNITVNGANVTVPLVFKGNTFITVYSQFQSFFLSNVNFNNTFGVSAEDDGALPTSVVGSINGNNYTFTSSGNTWNLTLDMGDFNNATFMEVHAYFSNGTELTSNVTIKVIKTPLWFATLLNTGLLTIKKDMTGQWNNTYSIGATLDIEFSDMIEDNITIEDFMSENFSFIPSITMSVSFNSTGNINLIADFTEKTPKIDVGFAGLAIGGSIEVQGTVQVTSNYSIKWVSAEVTMKIFGSVAVNIPILGDTFDVLGTNITIGLSATIMVNPGFAVSVFFEPSTNSSNDIINGIAIEIQQITGTINVPVTLEINGGIGIGGISGGGTIDIITYLESRQPYDEGGIVTGKIFINYNVLWFSGTIYSIGPSTFYSWGNASSSASDPSSNFTQMNRYFNITGYDSIVWINGSVKGIAVHDIYPQTSISSVYSGGTDYIFYTDDNVSRAVNQSLYIKGLELNNSTRAISRLNIPLPTNEITLAPKATVLPNGTILLVWSAVPDYELGYSSPFQINKIIIQSIYYDPSTGTWYGLSNITKNGVAVSYLPEPSTGGGEVAVVTSKSLLSSTENLMVYSIQSHAILYNVTVTNVSEIESFNPELGIVTVQEINGSISQVDLSQHMLKIPTEPGFILVSISPIKPSYGSLVLLYRSFAQSRVIIVNESSGELIFNQTFNMTFSKVYGFIFRNSTMFAGSLSNAIYVYKDEGGVASIYSIYNESNIYNFGISSSGSSAFLWSLLNYNNATYPLLNLSLIDIGHYYNVTFEESGLPPGTIWHLNVTGGPSLSSSTDIITLQEPNGTYSYSIETSNKEYAPIEPTGSFSVNGSNVNISVAFQLVTYEITFTETGLPTGRSWSVTLNGTTYNSTTDTITFSVSNGTYSYTIRSVSGYTASPSSGSITVNGANVDQAITFTSVTTQLYTITFTETGLPSGTSWSVTLNGNTETSTTNTISFTEPNGTYSFTISPINGYSVSPSSGSITVKGTNISQNITFTSVTTTTPPSSTNYLIYIIIAVVVIAAAIGAIFAMGRRKNKPSRQ